MCFWEQISKKIQKNNEILPDMFDSNAIKKGMRKTDGSGILVGITNISEAAGKRDGAECRGQILYRGIDLEKLVEGISQREECGYEETAYLLLTGELPTLQKKKGLQEWMQAERENSRQAIEDIVNSETGRNIMNILARSVLRLYDYDDWADDVSMENLTRQAARLIALMPLLSACIYRKKITTGFYRVEMPHELNTAESILYVLRGGRDYSRLETQILDTCLILHAELGGGNNSTFTAQVVSSTGADTYGVIASAISSIKGAKHGGANRKAFEMMLDLKEEVRDWEDEKKITAYLSNVLNRNAFDKSGLIYGIGHAVFTKSDPRAEIFRGLACRLAQEKGRQREYELYERVERLSTELIRKEKKLEKSICANVDYYTGFIYDMLGIPSEMFTPMFVNARIAGWCAHRIEEMCNGPKIIHPGYRYAGGVWEYIPIEERNDG